MEAFGPRAWIVKRDFRDGQDAEAPPRDPRRRFERLSWPSVGTGRQTAMPRGRQKPRPGQTLKSMAKPGRCTR